MKVLLILASLFVATFADLRSVATFQTKGCTDVAIRQQLTILGVGDICAEQGCVVAGIKKSLKCL